MKTRGRWVLAVLLLVGLVAVSCGNDTSGDDAGPPPSGEDDAPSDDDGDDGDAGGSTGDDGSAGDGASGEPVAGGTLVVGTYLSLSDFDPVTPYAAVAYAGGSELAAIYDVLFARDFETGEYVGRTAETLTPNDDLTEWTLTLRPGIEFTDGNPYDAEAVRVNIERHFDPAGGGQARPILEQFVESMTVIDPVTLVFALTQPWGGFPALLAREVGMIASPDSLADSNAEFQTAVGAGPFMVDEFVPGEAMELVRNPDYYGGEVLLERIEFVHRGDEAVTYEALKLGEIDAMVSRTPQIQATAATDGTPSILTSNDPFGNGIVMNSGIEVTCSEGEPAAHCQGQSEGSTVSTGSPTEDIDVRRAVALAIDPEVVNQRAYDGTAIATKELFPSQLPWSPGIDPLPYDLEEAQRLVEEAKAAGWDGHIRVDGHSGTADLALAVASMLELAGMDVELDSTQDSATLTGKVLVQRDFDVAVWGLGMNSDVNFVYMQLLAAFGGARYGYESPELSAAMDDLAVATDTADQVEAIGAVAQVLTDDAPIVSFSLGQVQFVTGTDVRGVQVDAQGRVNFDEAWIDA